MKADLQRVAQFERMTVVGEDYIATDDTDAELERAGKEPTTAHDSLADRTGYEPEFLEGWAVELPQPKGARRDDLQPLRRGGRGAELKYTHFSVLMSASRHLPMLTATNIDASKSRRVPRIQTWSFDGRLNKEDQWGDALYDANPLDRGHMVRREDPVWGTPAEARQANIDTFHFTNSCPQMARINQSVWLGLENYILHNARADKMRVSVFTGPYFTSKDLKYRGARVPGAFWKVIAFITDDGRPSATAYRVGQEDALEELEYVFGPYKTFQISLQQVVAKTGIDFSALLPYDGFTEAEAARGESVETELDSLESVRV